MVFKDNECAAGVFPLQGDAETDAPNQFTPTKVSPKGDIGLCHLCDQATMIKQAAPRKGYFVWHKSSVKGAIPQGFKGNTQYSNVPPRVRGRRQ